MDNAGVGGGVGSEGFPSVHIRITYNHQTLQKHFRCCCCLNKTDKSPTRAAVQHTHAHARTHAYSSHTHTHARAHTHTRARERMHAHTRTHAQTHTRVRTHSHTYSRTHTLSLSLSLAPTTCYTSSPIHTKVPHNNRLREAFKRKGTPANKGS